MTASTIVSISYTILYWQLAVKYEHSQGVFVSWASTDQCKDTITAQIFRNVPKNRGYPYGLKMFVRTSLEVCY